MVSRKPEPEPSSTEGPVSLGRFIHDRRVKLDISKAEAAQRAGVSRRTWHDIEEGYRPTPTAVTLAQFDQVLGLPEGTLFAMSGRSANRRIETLRERAIELVRIMAVEDLEAFIESQGTETLRAMVAQLARDIEAMRSELGDGGATATARRRRNR